MPILVLLLYIYCAGAVLSALRLLWHMYFKLDRYDWQYDKPDIWMTFGITSLLWPLLAVASPGDLLEPSSLFKKEIGGIGIDFAGRMRELDQLRNNPPHCSSVIRYRPAAGGGHEGMHGEFLFSAADVETILTEFLQEHPNLADDHEGGILNWLSQRDASITMPVDPPMAWSRFLYVADALLQHGMGESRCLQCGEVTKADRLTSIGKPLHLGANFRRWQCSEGHALLSIETVHLM